MSADSTDYEYDDWDFTLLENLPTVHECVLAIVQHALSYGKAKQKQHIRKLAWLGIGREDLERTLSWNQKQDWKTFLMVI